MADKKPNWRSVADKRVVGEKRELKTLAGYWIKPRKYSVQGSEEISAANFRAAKGYPAHIQRKLREIYKEIKGDDPEKEVKFDELQEYLPDEILDEMTRIAGESGNTQEILRLKLMYGIHSHNLDGVDNARIDEDLAMQILEYEHVTREMVKLIDEVNPPLGSATSEISKMSPSGSTNEESSPKTVETSQTDETQSSS